MQYIKNQKLESNLYLIIPGTDPITSLQRKFYAMQIFKHSDWLLKFINQSGCLKIIVA